MITARALAILNDAQYRSKSDHIRFLTEAWGGTVGFFMTRCYLSRGTHQFLNRMYTQVNR